MPHCGASKSVARLSLLQLPDIFRPDVSLGIPFIERDRSGNLDRVPRLATLVTIVLSVTISISGNASAQTADHSLDKVIELTSQRLRTADAVAGAKWGTRTPIDDPVREAQLYRRSTALGTAKGLPADWVRSVFFGQIEANKTVQRGLYAWWNLTPNAAPTTRPDLAAIRPVIDRINAAIVDQLAVHRDTLTGPQCPAAVADSVLRVTARHRTDLLHQAALVAAATSLCAPAPNL